MGIRGDNGGGTSPDGGVPDLPPEWGDIVIPDDISALADETAVVRAELQRRQPGTRRQRFTALAGIHALSRLGRTGLRLPLLVLLLAVLITLVSVSASTWSGPARPAATPRTPYSDPDRRSTLPALELVGAEGQTVPLRGRMPAVILLIDGCDCGRLVADTAAAVRADIAVITVVSGTGPAGSSPSTSGTAPAGETSRPGPTVQRLRDPASQLRATFDLGTPDGTAAALLVDHAGQVVRRVGRTASVEDLRPDLARL